jgi:hypothetical protein
MRIGLIAGFAFGYYVGSRAGRGRYEQIRRLLEEARQSRAVAQAQGAVERGIERLRERTAATLVEFEPEASS